MGNFKVFADAVNHQFGKMCGSNTKLYLADIERDDLWNAYIKAFPEGTNPMFRERTEHDCQTCRTYIRNFGNIIAIKNNKLVSIWDNYKLLPEPYCTVSKEMSKLVRLVMPKSILLAREANMGSVCNVEENEKGNMMWHHFYGTMPRHFVDKENRNELMAQSKTKWGSLLRAFRTFTRESIETTLELIKSKENPLYRGTEYLDAVKLIKKLKTGFDSLHTVSEKKLYTWEMSVKNPNITGIRTSVIGTLLQDISEGVPIDEAVGSFEHKVAPANFKRSSALVTKSMIELAQKKIIELKREKSLYRRHAIISDLTINNTLFADKSAKKAMHDDPFASLLKNAPTSLRSHSGKGNGEDVSAEVFFTSIVPRAISMEVLFEHTHEGNLCSIIAPEYADAPNLFKWDNGFSWTYNGNVTDTLKERVQKAGGQTDAYVRFSLEWFNTDDLDAHAYEPRGNHIEFGNKGHVHLSSGMLDVDMNVNAESTEPVENIIWTDKNKMPVGTYELKVHQYTNRNQKRDAGFVCEVECNGIIHTYAYDKEVRQSEFVTVCKFHVLKDKTVNIENVLQPKLRASTKWGLKIGEFHPVDLAMLSPNFWDDQKAGNKHWFFMLRDCVNEDQCRGFYNEFLAQDLHAHRKVFEHLGAKMMIAANNNPEEQMSGLGFSSTLHAQLKCRVNTDQGRREYNIQF